MTLEEKYRGETKILDLYRKKLIEPGWAGELSKEELKYIRDRLASDKVLRYQWGFKRGDGYRLSSRMIRYRAMYGVNKVGVENDIH